MTGSRRRFLVGVALGCVALVAAPVASAAAGPPARSPEVVLKAYLRAVYARNYPAAYDLISRADRRLKSREVYVREQGAFGGAALEIADAVAALIRYENLVTHLAGDRAVLTFRAILPDANAPAVDRLALGFDEARLAALAPRERAAIARRLADLQRAGQLPVVVGTNERWELLREDGAWGVFLNWAGAVTVRFEGVTKAGLPWEFVPTQPVIRAKPGETLHTRYRVRNRARTAITAKARHVLDPPEDTGHLQIITCFCLLQQTLEPGETQELAVTFRVSYEIPDSVREVTVRYEYYPLDRFPGDGRR